MTSYCAARHPTGKQRWKRLLAASFGVLLVLAGCTQHREVLPEPPSIGSGPASARPGYGPAGPVALTGGGLANAGNRRLVSGQPRVQIFPARDTAPLQGPITPVIASETGDITLNFVNADVKDFVRATIGDVLHLNVAIDPRVQGQVTLQTNRPLKRDAVRQVVEAVLKEQGISLLPAGNVINVVPSADGRGSRPGGPGNLEAIPLAYANPEDMLGALRGLVPQGVVLRAIPARGVLLVGGAPNDIDAVRDLVNVFDVDALAGMSYALFRPHYTDARSIRTELLNIFGGGDAKKASSLRLFVIARLNAVLAMSHSPQVLREAGSWVERLDQGSDGEEQRIFIYNVQNGRATELADVLTRLLAPAPTARQAASPADTTDPGGQPAAPDATSPGFGGLTQGGGAPAAASPAPIARVTASPLPARPDTAVPSPPNDGTDMTAAPDATSATPRVRIIPDDANNALIIHATATEYRDIESALARLDVPPLQVLIEAAVAEVTLTNELRHGVQWYLRSGILSTTLTGNTGGEVAPSYPGFSAVLSNKGINVVLTALEAITKVNVISSPSMMVLNNRPATLLVGDEVPIATQQATSLLTTGAPLVNSIQYRPTGVILKVTPRVNSNGQVRLEISQEISNVTTTTTSALSSPTIQQRRFHSTLSVRDGETIALGGLIQDRREKDNSGIPILMDIPVIGNVFKTADNKITRTEVLVLITPHVVRSDAEIRALTDDLRRRMSLPPSPAQPPRR